MVAPPCGTACALRRRPTTRRSPKFADHPVCTCHPGFLLFSSLLRLCIPPLLSLLLFWQPGGSAFLRSAAPRLCVSCCHAVGPQPSLPEDVALSSTRLCTLFPSPLTELTCTLDRSHTVPAAPVSSVSIPWAVGLLNGGITEAWAWPQAQARGPGIQRERLSGWLWCRCLRCRQLVDGGVFRPRPPLARSHSATYQLGTLRPALHSLQLSCAA